VSYLLFSDLKCFTVRFHFMLKYVFKVGLTRFFSASLSKYRVECTMVVKFETFRIKFEKVQEKWSSKAVLMPESQSRSSSEDHSMLASLWPICSIMSMSRKLQTCTFIMFFTVQLASMVNFLSLGLFIRVMHHFHILNFMNFIENLLFTREW